MNFKDILSGYPEYQKLLKNLSKTPVSIAGIVESAQAQFVYETTKTRNALVVLPNDLEAKRIYKELKVFSENVYFYPSKEYIFYSIDATTRSAEQERLTALFALLEKEETIVVASIEAILQYTIPREILEKNIFSINLGESYDLTEITDKLVALGFSNEEIVEGKGQFSKRGGILDVYLPQEQNPVRIEFFGDEIDSLRSFDLVSQRSTENIDSVKLFPCHEVLFDDEKRKKLISLLEKEAKKLSKKEKNDEKDIIEQDIELLGEGKIFPHIDKYASFIYDGIYTILDYFSSDDFVYLIEPRRINESAKSNEWEKGEILDDLSKKGILVLKNSLHWESYKNFTKTVAEKKLISLNILNHTTLDYQYNSIYNFLTKTTVSFHGKSEYLLQDLSLWKKENYTIVILSQNKQKAENLAGFLKENGHNVALNYDSDEIEKEKINIMVGSVGRGFEYPDIKFILISEQEILKGGIKARKKPKNADRIKSYNDLNVGDYVVHQTHGIGKYLGLNEIEVNKVKKAYLKIQYQGTDVLYVPVDQMDYVYKYIGGDEVKLKLNRLGGTDWSKTKAKVKSGARDIAKQLISLYAARQNTKGFAFSEDTPWQKDFEDTFLYQETEDQLQSIDEVKRDMESQRPMDRLLCGDVGYGKTEVALRASFKAATDSKQVAYLCPTTVLAMQHYNNFCARMENFPIKIEMLSRFKTQKEQTEILKKLKTGEIDIIIGTHRILQKDVEFHDLGLLIIDEEQRFGVSDKERLKELKRNVDALSMTATPIPRTLHMSMINVRDMSVLETPPENRYPVQTYVMEHNQLLLADAMKKELARGGQVFYLYNRVAGIYRTAEWIKKLIPEARIAVGHGKMSEDELERVMEDMVNGSTDILVCTTIIETGLDIPNANTMIVENADRMGLSQLYQLRGRVGRSNRNAYAYFTYKKDGVLSSVAEKRLSAIKEFTEFGSGFKIALRDLEIRGAGDILGASQHGHMNSVGYDMYSKILKSAIDEEQGIFEKEEIVTQIDLQLDAYIPEKYIKNHNQRIDAYKNIASIKTDEDAIDTGEMLCDRYGDMPRQVRTLIEVAKIKAKANEFKMTMISEKAGNLYITFDDEEFDIDLIIRLCNKFPDNLKFLSGEHPRIVWKIRKNDGIISNIKFILHELFELKNGKN